MYKIQWSHHDDSDASWETGDYLLKAYENFYKQWLVTQISGQDFYKGGRDVTPLVLSMHLHCNHEHKHHLCTVISCDARII